MSMKEEQSDRDVVLGLQEFGVAFGNKVPLASLNLEVSGPGVTVLLGPSGTGKSTLVRSIAGLNDNNPAFRWWGTATYRGRPLANGNRPALSVQSARLYLATVWENVIHGHPRRGLCRPSEHRDLAKELLRELELDLLIPRLEEPAVNLELHEQRLLALARLLAADPALVLLDEPTTGLAEAEAHALLDQVRAEANRRAVLVVLHNQQHALHAGGQAVFLAGGVIQETGPTESVLRAPQTEITAQFVRTGSCSVPSPGTDPAQLAEDSPPPAPIPDAARLEAAGMGGPTGFLWVKRGRLAGTPRPGVVKPVDYDMEALRRMGINILITLTEDPMDAELLSHYGMRGIWCPIADMHPPTVTEAWTLCADIESALEAGAVIAVHCYAGLGRTGTVLACYLIWEGQKAVEALEYVRRLDPRWVQSDAQVQFLDRFARCVAQSRTSADMV